MVLVLVPQLHHRYDAARCYLEKANISRICTSCYNAAEVQRTPAAASVAATQESAGGASEHKGLQDCLASFDARHVVSLPMRHSLDDTTPRRRNSIGSFQLQAQDVPDVPAAVSVSNRVGYHRLDMYVWPALEAQLFWGCRGCV